MELTKDTVINAIDTALSVMEDVKIDITTLSDSEPRIIAIKY